MTRAATELAIATCLIAVCAVCAGCTSGGSASGPATVPTGRSPAVPEPGESGSAMSGDRRAAPTIPDWPAYHGDAARSGYSAAMPAPTGGLTSRQIRLDAAVYASPLVVGGAALVATERNSVYSLGPDGAQRWRVNLGPPTPLSALPCGNIDPLGITGTPVYDPASGLLFVVASLGTGANHDLVALDPGTGAVRWRHSIDLPGVDRRAMQQRGALTVLGGRVWVPFGGLAGDCGAYKGRLIGVPVGGGPAVSFTVPTTREGGIWAPPGPVVLGSDLLVAVGNGESLGTSYDYSDSVLRLAGTRLVDSFSPATWAADNAADLDLGSQGPALVGTSWVFAAGKSGQAYVLRQGALGGIGGEVSRTALCVSFGGTAVRADTVYVPCTDGVRAVRVDAAGRLHPVWRAPPTVSGSPIVGGGFCYAVDAQAGVLYALDRRNGVERARVSVGSASRFATPAVMGRGLLVPTLSGVSFVSIN